MSTPRSRSPTNAPIKALHSVVASSPSSDVNRLPFFGSPSAALQVRYGRKADICELARHLLYSAHASLTFPFANPTPHQCGVSMRSTSDTDCPISDILLQEGVRSRQNRARGIGCRDREPQSRRPAAQLPVSEDRLRVEWRRTVPFCAQQSQRLKSLNVGGGATTNRTAETRFALHSGRLATSYSLLGASLYSPRWVET